MADEGLRDRLTRSGEDALGKLAQDLLENPLVNGAISRAFEARERASHAQEAALGALNIPSAGDVERLTRRLRSVSQRLEGIEDGVDRLHGQMVTMSAPDANPMAGLEERLAGIESQLAKLSGDIAAMSRAVDAAPAPQPREQERLAVDAPAPKPKRRSAAKKKSS
jgi:CRP-like cAMP-binding protein